MAISKRGDLLLSVIAVLNSGVADCQSQLPPSIKSQLEFDVASVKMVPDSEKALGFIGGAGTSTPGRLTYSSSFIDLLQRAYDVYANEIFGPAWISTTKFRIDATLPFGTTKEDMREMLQNLLVERFDLKVHRENRSLQVYELSQAKAGAKLTVAAVPSGDADPLVAQAFSRPVHPDLDSCPQVPSGVHRMQAYYGPNSACEVYRKFTMAQLAESLEAAMYVSHRQREQVIDKTGIPGEFDFQLRYQRSPAPDQPETRAAPRDEIPGVMSALGAIGLKLTKTTGVFSVLVVDDIRREPHAN
jgi:uncharacterized protein (TIGR03435 family)